MKASTLLLGASALAFASCGVAQAQDAPASSTTQSDTQQSDSDTAPTHDIVVTAERRSENLMTTPISASVLTGKDLANKGVTNVDALQFAMPSVTVNNFGQGNDFNVRGIGKAEHNTQTTTGVIVYRDGVPTFPGYVQGEPYYDIADIQVLRGPQGTIVGQNATGGAVFVNTNDPVIDGGVHGYVQANYGNYNDAGAQGAINLPLSDTFAVRVAAFVLSAMMTGLAGGIFSSISGFISPESFPFFQSILFLLVVMIGGADRTLGPLFGAIVVVLLPEILSFLAGYRLLFVDAPRRPKIVGESVQAA